MNTTPAVASSSCFFLRAPTRAHRPTSRTPKTNATTVPQPPARPPPSTLSDSPRIRVATPSTVGGAAVVAAAIVRVLRWLLVLVAPVFAGIKMMGQEPEIKGATPRSVKMAEEGKRRVDGGVRRRAAPLSHAYAYSIIPRELLRLQFHLVPPPSPSSITSSSSSLCCRFARAASPVSFPRTY